MAFAHNPVNWFEIPTVDIERAKAFYASAFGFEFTDMQMDDALMAFFPMEMDKPGVGGALVKTENCAPSVEGTTVYFPVDDIEKTLQKISSAGGATVIPKTDIGQFGHFGQFKDSEGNRVGLHTPPAGTG